MEKQISRREFLRRSLIGAAVIGVYPSGHLFRSEGESLLGRVAASSVRVWSAPGSDSQVVYQLNRDELVRIYDQVDVAGYRNPIWYRIWGGYIHSGFIQPVKFDYQHVIEEIPEKGCLFEVSVPYTRSYRLERGEWVRNFRLYFNSTHWVSALSTGPDGKPWYQIKDSYGRSYFARASHLRRVQPGELEPISPEVPRNQKWIEIDIEEQELTAFEYGSVVLRTKISSGLPLLRELEPGELPTETPLGDHHIKVKTVSRHMGDEHFTDALDSGAYPGVPWVCFFDKDGYSLHGTYWHNNFGNRMSHGCVNMRCEDAKWIYRWALPVSGADDWQISGWGIRVSIRP